MEFITKSADAESAQTLLEAALPLMAADGRIPWSKVEAVTGIKYSRGWLIVRRAWLEANNPEALVDLNKVIPSAMEKYGQDYDFFRHVLGAVVADHRDKQELSWGEIAVRVGRPESQVRKAYRALGAKKDLGLRIGKGGRFAYDEPVLYQDNMKAEGAYIPVTVKMRPALTECLNFHPKDEAKVPARRTRKAKASA